MATLRRDTQILASQLSVAESPWTRAKGLLGRDSLSFDEVLWIKPCNNIHTFFMKFPIDVVFTDKTLKVLRVHHNVKPNRIVFAHPWKVRHTFECAVGFLTRHKICEGDQLHVGS